MWYSHFHFINDLEINGLGVIQGGVVIRDMVKEIPRTDSVRSGKCLPSHKVVSRDSVLMVLVNHHEETEESENE